MIEEVHPPVVAQNIITDSLLIGAVSSALSSALGAIESNIHARIPGRSKPVQTGIGAFAVLIYRDKVLAFLFDVSVLKEDDPRSYPIEASTLGQSTTGVAALQ